MSQQTIYKINAYFKFTIYATLAAFCLYLSFERFQAHRRYPTEGKIVQAFATSNQYTETRRRFFFIKSYATDLAFKTEDGQTVHLPKNNISKAEWAMLQQGQTIAREYLPEDPQGTARQPNDPTDIWVMPFMALIAALMAWGYWPSKENDAA